jgi:hypothetical protein
MIEKFPPKRESEKKKEMPCERCGKLDHSTENCPHLTEEERRRLIEKRQQMEKNIKK